MALSSTYIDHLPTMHDAHRVATVLEQVLDPGEVLLFGSVARGEQGVGSDLDLVLVFDDLGDYGDRRRIVAEARSVVMDSIGLVCDVRVTDRPEWEARAKRCRSTFEAAIASYAVTLLSRPPRVVVDWVKEIGMVPTDAGQAANSLANTNHALNSLISELRPSFFEADALSVGDLRYADDLKRSRMLNVCAQAQAVIETSLKALIHALKGPYPARTHRIADLMEVASRNLSEEASQRLIECFGTVTPAEASVWRSIGTYPADIEIEGDPAKATEQFAAEMATVATRMALSSISLIEQELGYLPSQADSCLARCNSIAQFQQSYPIT
ncbi:MAG: nucleotidyltransferase domain-containing protein [bacterium]|nr:nucleotidyltransferase domain-containing protein [bacterium]